MGHHIQALPKIIQGTEGEERPPGRKPLETGIVDRRSEGIGVIRHDQDRRAKAVHGNHTIFGKKVIYPDHGIIDQQVPIRPSGVIVRCPGLVAMIVHVGSVVRQQNMPL